MTQARKFVCPWCGGTDAHVADQRNCIRVLRTRIEDLEAGMLTDGKMLGDHEDRLQAVEASS